MTELDMRKRFVDKAVSFLNLKEADGSFKHIIDLYNSITPLPSGYRLTYSDPWCAGFVSAVAQACGYTRFIFPECSCDRMIAAYSRAGRWQEDDAYRPQVGDIIMYDWDDNGIGDNRGSADHVGIVTFAGTSQMTILEGNKSDSVAYRYINYNAKYIRGYCLPDFAGAATGNASQSIPSVDTGSAPTGGAQTTSGDRIIKFGMTGEDVKEMQKMLNAVGCSVGSYGADGDFGEDTLSALKKFQRQKGLLDDGEYGPLSKAALEKAYNTIVPESSGDVQPSADGNKEVDEIVYDYLMSKLCNHIAVCGIMGNIYAESGMRSNNLQNDHENIVGYSDDGYTKAVDNKSYSGFVGDGAGYGLCQWTFWSRKQGLLEYAQGKGVSISDPQMQVEFLYKELQTQKQGRLIESLLLVDNLKDATRMFMADFENPADQSESHLEKRVKYSRTYYDKFAGRSVTNSDADNKDGNNTQTEQHEPSVGDLCMFTGNTQYIAANSDSGFACKPGLAKVTLIAKGKKHPYHLIRVYSKGSTVYGWVDAKDVSAG